MTREDTLPIQMEKLEIESTKINKNPLEENPFMTSLKFHRKTLTSKSLVQKNNCSCSFQKRNDKYITICKKRHKKILKEPVLDYLQSCKKGDNEDASDFNSKITLLNNNCYKDNQAENINLCVLVHNCNKLRISADKKVLPTNCYKKHLVYERDIQERRKDQGNLTEKVRTGPSCSQEALNPPCDVTIDELASYFETLVHIPKKMSSMAEMMYI